MEKDAIANMGQLTVNMSEQIDSFYSELNHFTFQIINTSELMDTMRLAADSKDTNNFFVNNIQAVRIAKNYLASHKGPGLNISRVSLLNDRGDYISLGVTPEDSDVTHAYLQSQAFQDSYKQMLRNDSIHFIGPYAGPFIKADSEQVVSFYRVFRNFMDPFGVIEIQISVSKFAKVLGVPDIGELDVYVFDKDGQPAYIKQGDATLTDITMKQLLGDQSPDNTIPSDYGRLDPSKYIMTYQQSPLSQWNIIIAQPKSVLLSSIKVVGRLIIIVSIIFIILSLIMVYVITRQLTKRMHNTVDLIRQVSLDNLSLTLDPADDEIILINRAFNRMFARLKDSMELEVQARSRELRARINALESQMDPHFLYNVLAVIGSVGEEAGVDKVMVLCEKLGYMFRYTTQHQDNEVTVHDEITYAQLYLDLMKERFEDHFQYRLEIDERALSYKVPRLIFQPLIDNCFRHAFHKARPPWVIHLSIRQTLEHDWLFEVKDWGDGFDPVVLEKLQRRMDSNDQSIPDYISYNHVSSENQGGVGLFNLLMRLRLTYGRQAYYEIITNNPTGTIVRIGLNSK